MSSRRLQSVPTTSGPRRTSHGAQVMRGEASTSGARRRRHNSSSSNDDDQPQQQTSQRREEEPMDVQDANAVAVRDGHQTTQAELDEQAAEMVHVLLALHDRKGVIRDADVKKAVPRLAAGAARRNLIKEAGRRLKRAFGLRLVQDEENKDRYFLQNAIVSEDTEGDDNDVVGFDLSRMDEAKRGLLYTVLMFLFMSKNPQLKSALVTEDELWRFLEDTGIRKDVTHPILGDIKKLIAANHQAEFVSHGWIEFHKSVDDSGDDGDNFIFAWGPRARVTVDRMMMLKMACLIMDNDAPENWTNHFAVARQAQQATGQQQNQ